MNKKLETAKKLIDKDKHYSIDEALEILPKISISKFTGSAEITINLNLNDKQKQNPIRLSVTYPNHFGRETKVLALVDNSKEKEAKDAGADYVGLDDYIKKIEEGWMDFDIVVATPAVMPKIAKLGKYIGKRGLMPNPKNQTVTDKIDQVVKQYKSGKNNYKIGEQGSLQVVFGKLDMNKEQLKQNLDELIKAIDSEKQKLGQIVVTGVYVSPTMGPSIKLNTKEIIK